MKKQTPNYSATPDRTEVRLADDEWIVTLKDGTKIDARDALAALAVLRNENQKHPDNIKQVFAVASDPSTDVSQEVQKGFFENGRLLEPTKKIILNAAIVSDNGIQIDDPFECTPNNDHVLNTVRENRPILERRFLDEIWKSNDGNEPDRSR